MKHIMLLFVTLPLLAQEVPAQKPLTTDNSKLYKISLVALAGASAADFATSVGKYEVNGMLRRPDGTFSVEKGIALKSVMVGSHYVVGKTFLKRHPRAAAIINFAAAGAFAYVAIHNSGVRRVR